MTPDQTTELVAQVIQEELDGRVTNFGQIMRRLTPILQARGPQELQGTGTVEDVRNALLADGITQAELDSVCDAMLEARGPQEATAQAWQDISTAPHNKIVLVHYVNGLGNGRTMRASFYPAGTLEVDDDANGDSNGFNAEDGWYEESEAYEYLMPLDGDPTHWQPLPAPPVAASPKDKS